MKAGLSLLLVASAALLTIGSLGLVIKRNVVVMLIGGQLMLAASGLAFVAFSRFGLGAVTAGNGAALALFAGLVGLAGLAVGVAMAAVVYREHDTLLVDEYESVAD
ncbi:MAG TPA: NADH-quinone oxidoreductase subunit K [Candidatus Dormibacteraeota bacterium]|jgi:NADH-quinone oxidoreductase subunit K